MNILKLFKKILLEEINKDEFYVISGDELRSRLDAASFSSSYLKPKFFEGKKIYVEGDLDLSNTPIKSLGNIAYITRDLDITNTNIKSLRKTKVEGQIYDAGSPYEKIREIKTKFQELTQSSDKRSSGDWDLSNEQITEVGLAANALFKFLVRDEILSEIDENELDELNEKINEYSNHLQITQNANISDLELDKIEEEGNEILNQISEVTENKADVYFIIPDGTYSERVYRFSVIGLPDKKFLVGLDEFMYKAALDYEMESLSQLDLDYDDFIFSNWLNEEAVESHIREFFDKEVRKNPKKYFEESDYELTWQQENRKNSLKSDINKLLSMPNNPDKKNTVKVMYMNKSGEVEFHEKTLEEVQSEFDAIKPPTEPTDDMIDEKVDELIVDLLEDDNKKVKWLQKNTTNFYDFIDFESWAKANVRHNGYGMLSSEGDSGWHDEMVETPTRRYHFHIIEENY